jgi:predicted polyphosphate/ATP-dependent NAD kinase
MSKVGIIANPASGKDIRRLVALATAFSNFDKTNILKRVILGLDSVGIEEVIMMPDYFGFGHRVREAFNHHALSCQIRILEFEIQGNQEDSILAAEKMQQEQVDCIITLGGDGTNRVVSKGCGEIPLVAISTGTNNVFPVMNEGTTAGIAAGILARKVVPLEEVTIPMKKIRVSAGNTERDMALIDAVVTTESFIGSKAIWNLEHVKQIILTQAKPGSIGISSIGAALYPVDCRDGFGLAIELGPGGEKIKAPIAPGLIVEVAVKDYQVLAVGNKVPIFFASSIISLDGERELEISESDSWAMSLEMDGPRLVDIFQTIRQASQKGFFRKNSSFIAM